MANPFDQFDEQASSNPFDQFDEQVDQFDEKKEKRATWGETGKALVDMLGEVGTSSVGGLMQASGELEKERLENALAATDRAVVLEAGMKSDPSAYKGLKSLGEFNKQFLSDIAPTEWKGKYQYAKQEVDRERKESERRADIGKLMFESSTRRQEKIRPDFKEKDWGKEFAFDVGVAAEKMVPPIIVGAITRNPALATAAMGPTVYGDMYGAQRMAGRAPDQAHQDAIASTVIELGTELPVFGRLFKFGRGGLKKIFDTTVLEGLSEGISSLLSTAYDAGVVNDDMTLAEAFTSAKTYQDALYEAAVGTALGGLMGGGVVPFDVAEQKKTIKFIKDSTADMQFQMMSDEQLSNMIKVGDQLSSEYGDQELSKFIDVLRSEQEIRADSKNQAEIAPQTIPDVTLESIGLPPSDAGISTAIDKIANAQNINEILSAVEDGVFKPIETPTIEAPTVESQNQQLIDQYFPETLPPMPVPGMTDIGPHRVIQNRMPETPTPEVTYGATRPDGGTTPEGSTGESIDTGRGMESVEPDRVPRSDVRDRMDIPQEPMASGGAAVSVGEPIVTKTLKEIRAEKALVQEKPEVAPTKATGDEAALIEGAKKSKSISDFKSWSIGRFGREKASELSSSGAIQKAWDQKSEVVTAKPEIEAAANEAATSPENNIPEPTQAQKEAGNYKVGRVSLHGMNISIENPKGSIRSGVDSDGESWNVEMKHHYGYIRDTIGKDKDHLDVFVGPEAENETLPVFVVDQINPNTKAFDEHKILLGFKNKLAAKRGYLSNYGKGWSGIGAVNKMTLDEFKGWIKSGDTTQAISYKEARKPFVKPTQEPIVEEKAAAEKETAGEAAGAEEKPVAEQKEEQRPSEYEETPKFMASDQTKTEAFKRWFGDSKVVDENGEPLVVYHGMSGELEGGKFDPERIGQTFRADEKGFFFVSAPSIASGYATSDSVGLPKEGGNVVPAYISLKTPLIIDDKFLSSEGMEKIGPNEDVISFWDNYQGLILDWADQKKSDGVILVDNVNKVNNNPVKMVVAFNPNQIKSAVGNIGTFNPADERINFMRGDETKTDVFYSELTKQVDSISQPKAPSSQWKAIINKLSQKGVKQEEISWSGVEQWLDEQSGTVTKEELVDYLRSQEVQIDELEKSEEFDGIINSEVLERLGMKVNRMSEDAYNKFKLDSGSAFYIDNDVIRIYEEEEDYSPVSDYYGVYDDDAVWGMGLGKESAIADSKEYIEGWDDAETEISNELKVDNGALTKYTKYQMPGKSSGYRELLLTLPEQYGSRITRDDFTVEKDGGRYSVYRKGSDKEEAWLSTEKEVEDYIERTINGKNNYETKKRNYTSSHWDEPNVIAHVRFNERTIDGKRTLFVEEIQSDWHQEGKKKGYGTGGVPEAPFKNTDTWAMLGMKRMIRYAAENGYKQIAWTPGSVQADRYDLSKQVDSIGWYSNPDNTYNISYKKDGITGTAKNGVLESELEGVVGKELAKKIINDSQEEAAGEFSGLDLKVGGEGMKGFYDNILPKAVQKFVKKFGSKVTVSEETPEVWKVSVTDKMKESAMEGFPMFKLSDKPAYAMPRKELDAAIDEIAGKWKGGPKIVVAESVDALPGEITSNPKTKKMMESLKSIVGVAHKGSIYVIGNKIGTAEQVERVLFHEAYGHYGLSKLFGNEIQTKLNQIYFGIGRSKGLNALAEKHGIDLTNYYKGTEGRTVEKRRAILTEELLAYIATDSKPSIARKAKEVIGAIRQWLRDHGLLRLSKISDTEIMYLLKQARKSVVTGKAGKGFNSDVRFMVESESSSNQLNKIIKGLHLEGDHATAAWYEQRMKSAKNIDRLLTQIKAEQEMPMFMSDSKNDATAVTMPKGRKAVEKFYDSLVYNIVDRFKDLKDIQKEIGEVPEPADAFLAQENFSGRARKRMDDLDDFHVRPLLKEMTKANISMEEAGKFLHARHAEEANAILKRRNPSETDLRNRINEIRQEQNDLYDNEDVAKYRKLKNSLDKAVNDVNESQSDETQTEILRGQINDLKSKSSEVKRYINLTERLAAAKKLNPYKGDNTALSGMSDEEAREILESYKNNAAMQDVAKRIDAINKEHLNKMVADEILTKEEANAWRKNYEKYVPLHRDEFIDEDGELIPLPSLPKKGQGYNIAGKESKLRTGSTKEVNHALIIPHVIAQYEASAIRGEKNIVNQALYELVKLYPDSNLWEIDKVEKRPSLNKDGEVIYQAGPRLYDNELDLKIKGESVKITFNNANPRARRLVRELKNLAGRDMPQFLRYTNTVMRYLSLVNTSLSPEFVLSNFARDLQTAGYNLGDTDLANMKARIIKDTVRHAVKGMWKNLRHDHSTEWSKYADEFERAGGMVGWIDSYDSIHDKAKRLERDMKLVGKGHIARKALRGLGEWIENANSAIENGVRLSAFVNARKMGMSSAKAANLAKNLTVNFNRRGAQSQYLNMAYLFFNASVQGSARMIAAVGKSAKVRRMVGATIIAAAILDIVNRSISGDDDDDRKYYDKIPTGIKDRNLIIMFGDGPEDFIKIPLPWGYNIFHIMGQMIGRGVSNYTGDDIKDYSVADEGARFLGATMEAFNPVASGTLMQTISPTLLDPAVMIAENKSWTGQPLMPEKIPFGPPKPRSEMYFRSASEPSKYIAETLNSLTGGNRLRPGVIDWSPEWIDELWSTSTGSAGRFLLNTIDTGAKIASGEEVERRNIPFARKILGNEYPSSDYELYYERKDDLSILANELKTFRGEERSAVIRDAGPKRKLIGLMKTTEKKLRILRKRRRLLEDKRASKEEIEKVTDQILSVIKLFNKRYQDTVNE